MLVYLIDDSAADAALIQLVAKQSDLAIEITHFEDGESALEALRQEGIILPDLVLLDLSMPGLSGHEVLREIRRDNRLRRLTVVILSSSEDDSDIGDSYDEFVNGYIVKPVNAAGFQRMMHSLVGFWFAIVTRPPAPTD